MTQTTAGLIIALALILYGAWSLWRHQISAVGMRVKVDTQNGTIRAQIVNIQWDRVEKDWRLTVETEQGVVFDAWRFECVATL